MTLIVIYCNDLRVIVLKMYKEAAVLLALMKMYTIPCHDKGHVNVMLVYRAAQILCKFCQGHLVRYFQRRLMVHVISAI